MSSTKLINYSQISLELTGNRNTIRANRNSAKYTNAIEELVIFLDAWVLKNSISNKAKVNIKPKG